MGDSILPTMIDQLWYLAARLDLAVQKSDQDQNNDSPSLISVSLVTFGGLPSTHDFFAACRGSCLTDKPRYGSPHDNPLEGFLT